jgi:hypothetical protein
MLADNERLQQSLLEYFDYLFVEKEKPVGAGTRLLAAQGWQVPRLFHAGRSLLLPQVSMALQGWHRLHPGS